MENKINKNIWYFLLFAILQLVLFSITLFSKGLGISKDIEEFVVNYVINFLRAIFLILAFYFLYKSIK
jgi:hypothetical protein